MLVAGRKVRLPRLPCRPRLSLPKNSDGRSSEKKWGLARPQDAGGLPPTKDERRQPPFVPPPAYLPLPTDGNLFRFVSLYFIISDRQMEAGKGKAYGRCKSLVSAKVAEQCCKNQDGIVRLALFRPAERRGFVFFEHGGFAPRKRPFFRQRGKETAGKESLFEKEEPLNPLAEMAWHGKGAVGASLVLAARCGKRRAALTSGISWRPLDAGASSGI